MPECKIAVRGQSHVAPGKHGACRRASVSDGLVVSLLMLSSKYKDAHGDDGGRGVVVSVLNHNAVKEFGVWD